MTDFGSEVWAQAAAGKLSLELNFVERLSELN